MDRQNRGNMMFMEKEAFDSVVRMVAHTDFSKKEVVVFYHGGAAVYFTTDKGDKNYYEQIKMGLDLASGAITYTFDQMRLAFAETIKHAKLCHDHTKPMAVRTTYSDRAAEALVCLFLAGELEKHGAGAPASQILHFYIDGKGRRRADYLITNNK